MREERANHMSLAKSDGRATTRGHTTTRALWLRAWSDGYASGWTAGGHTGCVITKDDRRGLMSSLAVLLLRALSLSGHRLGSNLITNGLQASHRDEVCDVWSGFASRDGSIQGLLEVTKEISDAFNTNANTDQIISDAQLSTLFSRNRGVRHDAWQLGKRFHGTKAFCESEHLDGLEEGARCFQITTNTEGHHATEARALALGNLMTRMGLKTRVDDLAHLRMSLQVAGNAESILGMLFHANVKGLETSVDEVAVKRAWHGTCGELDELESFSQLFVVHDCHTHQHIRMAIIVFGDGSKLDISAKVKRLLEVRGHERVVDNKEAVLVLSLDLLGNFTNVCDLQQRVGGRLKPDKLGVGCHGSHKVVNI
eukprot:m.254529 g.254529  ORF g.254529 m.254529 type:complete len:368 (+) comp18187_c0_seq1:216-1319(+)